jgi:signal peptidase I
MEGSNVSAAETQSKVRKCRWAFKLRPLFRDILVALAIAFFVVIFIIQPVKVEGTSMQPHLADQDRIFVSRLIYRFADIRREDVVVFWYPKDRSKSFIKRVIGIPGDEVEIREGVLYVNGSRICEPYLSSEFQDYRSFPKAVVPSGQYFVLGDHRNSSNDSRQWGCVERNLIYGKAVFSYWPIARLGFVE